VLTAAERNAFLEEKHIALLEILNILGKENRLELTIFLIQAKESILVQEAGRQHIVEDRVP
jgi:hypothetical protein